MRINFKLVCIKERKISVYRVNLHSFDHTTEVVLVHALLNSFGFGIATEIIFVVGLVVDILLPHWCNLLSN